MTSEKTYIAKELVKIMYQPLEKFRQLDNVRYYFDGVERDSLVGSLDQLVGVIKLSLLDVC